MNEQKITELCARDPILNELRHQAIHAPMPEISHKTYRSGFDVGYALASEHALKAALRASPAITDAELTAAMEE